MNAEKRKEQIAAGIEIVRAVADAIQAVGHVPSGELYAHLMSKLSLEVYENVIGCLIRAELVKRDQSHMLVWIGPEKVN